MDGWIILIQTEVLSQYLEYSKHLINHKFYYQALDKYVLNEWLSLFKSSKKNFIYNELESSSASWSCVSPPDHFTGFSIQMLCAQGSESHCIPLMKDSFSICNLTPCKDIRSSYLLTCQKATPVQSQTHPQRINLDMVIMTEGWVRSTWLFWT